MGCTTSVIAEEREKDEDVTAAEKENKEGVTAAVPASNSEGVTDEGRKPEKSEDIITVKQNNAHDEGAATQAAPTTKEENGRGESTASTEGLPPVVAQDRDSLYFYELVTFKVEGRLFRVPRAKLEEQSTFFRTMFKSAQLKKVDGSDDGKPIELEEVSKKVFRDLLGFLYPNKSLRGTETDSPPGYFDWMCICSWDRDRLLAVLDLARRWQFRNIDCLVVKKLNEKFKPLYADIVDNILAVQKYKLTFQYKSAYRSLALRKDPLTSEERQRLGDTFTDSILMIRERHLVRLVAMYEERVRVLRLSEKSSFGKSMSASDNLHAQVVAFRENPLVKVDLVWGVPPPENKVEEAGKLDQDIIKMFNIPQPSATNSTPQPGATTSTPILNSPPDRQEGGCSCTRL